MVTSDHPSFVFPMKDIAVPATFEDVIPPADRVLDDEHRKILEAESGIAPDVIAQRGYYSPTADQIKQLVELEIVNPAALKATGWLAIPVYRPDGVKHGEVIRVFGTKLKQKYLWPTGSRNCVDIHPASMDYIDDRTAIVWITEGTKKADAILSAARREGIACIVLAINGNYGWRTTIEGGKVVSPDFQDIPLTDRKVYIVPDSDYRSNDNVARGFDDLSLYLVSKTGDHRTFLTLVPPKGRDKQGVDDYLAAGGTLDHLIGLAETPRFAATNHQPDNIPLLVKSGMRLIEDAKDGIPHIITPLFPEGSILLMAGHTGTLKTWHAQSMMLDMAFGFKWLDNPSFTSVCGPINSLYINKEMSGIVLGQRLGLLSRHDRYQGDKDLLRYNLENRIFSADEAILDMRDPTQRDRVEEAIIINDVKVVFLDSFSMTWTGDENSNSEVGAYYNHLRQITERTGVAWVLILHLDKPQGRAATPSQMVFSIRGAGQLVQQADAALILARFDPAAGLVPGEKQVSIYHAKARTDLEVEAFISSFQNPDGMNVGMKYLHPLKNAEERSYSISRDPTSLDKWLVNMALGMPEFRAGGMRESQFISLVTSSWPKEDPHKISAEKLKARVKHLLEVGDLSAIDGGVSGPGGKLLLLGAAYLSATSDPEGEPKA
jgi:hypothetical protein